MPCARSSTSTSPRRELATDICEYSIKLISVRISFLKHYFMSFCQHRQNAPNSQRVRLLYFILQRASAQTGDERERWSGRDKIEISFERYRYCPGVRFSLLCAACPETVCITDMIQRMMSKFVQIDEKQTCIHHTCEVGSGLSTAFEITR